MAPDPKSRPTPVKRKLIALSNAFKALGQTHGSFLQPLASPCFRSQVKVRRTNVEHLTQVVKQMLMTVPRETPFPASRHALRSSHRGLPA